MHKQRFSKGIFLWKIFGINIKFIYTLMQEITIRIKSNI